MTADAAEIVFRDEDPRHPPFLVRRRKSARRCNQRSPFAHDFAPLRFAPTFSCRTASENVKATRGDRVLNRDASVSPSGGSATVTSAPEGAALAKQALDAGDGGAAARGSAPAWERTVEQLVRERGDALLRYATLLTGNPDDGADMVQDALVRTFSRLQNGFSVERAEAYVRRAILNSTVDRARRGSRWRRIAPLAFEQDARPSASEQTDTRLDLAGQLMILAPRERACIVLRYYEDLKVDDIAAALGISSGAVKRYLSDAMAKLSSELGRSQPSPLPHEAATAERGAHRRAGSPGGAVAAGSPGAHTIGARR
ncbi:sigma-70 family RNA polymerase sigma factor [Ruicaihuangia caeni]|uniref:sigma-70 family RNA polymerase sigma factor n=1 Tax=Ruicaihuangia caeni TaxID=3042517 RepID=UPI00338E97CE